MAIMTPEEEEAWVKVNVAVYVLGGYVLAKTGRVRFTCNVRDLPDDDNGDEDQGFGTAERADALGRRR